MYRLLGRTLGQGTTFVEERVALGPEFLADDRLDAREDPLLAGFELPVLPLAQRLGVVGASGPFGDRVTDQTVDSRVGELATIASPVPLLVEQPRDGLLALVFQEELEDELPDWRFLRIDLELVILPLIAEWGSPARRLPELGADRD